MEREIKFRAWNYKKMVYNVAIRNSLIVNHIDLFTYKNGEANYSVMQFTGMYDKNDNQIYEGDICKVTHFNHSSPNSIIIQVVRYESGTFILKKENTKSNLEDDKTNVPLYYCHAPNKIEIIGNIHEHPQLLNQ